MDLGAGLRFVDEAGDGGLHNGTIQLDGDAVGTVQFMLFGAALTVLRMTANDGAPHDLCTRVTQALLGRGVTTYQHFGVTSLHTLRWYQRTQGPVVSGVLHGLGVQDHPIELLDLTEGSGLTNLTVQLAKDYDRLHNGISDEIAPLWSELEVKAKCAFLRRAVLTPSDLPRWPLHLAALRDVSADVRLYASKQLYRATHWHPAPTDLFAALNAPMYNPLHMPVIGDEQHTRRNVRTAILYILGRIVSASRASDAPDWTRQTTTMVHRTLAAEASTWTPQHDLHAVDCALVELTGGPHAAGGVGDTTLFALCRAHLHRHHLVHRLGLHKQDRLAWLHTAVREVTAGVDATTLQLLMTPSPQTAEVRLPDGVIHRIQRRA